MSGKHLSSQFEADLNQLSARIMAMGGAVEQQLKHAATAMQTGADVTRVADLGERSINEMEREVDAHCAFLIASRQPAAQDLRFVLSMLKVCNNLERVGDEAYKLCLRATAVHSLQRHEFKELQAISAAMSALLQMADTMIHQALDCLARLSTNDAKRLLAQDTQLDIAYRELIALVVRAMSRLPDLAAPLAELLFLLKAIERMGDHATNIAESVIYIVLGDDIRHTYEAV